LTMAILGFIIYLLDKGPWWYVSFHTYFRCLEFELVTCGLLFLSKRAPQRSSSNSESHISTSGKGSVEESEQQSIELSVQQETAVSSTSSASETEKSAKGDGERNEGEGDDDSEESKESEESVSGDEGNKTNRVFSLRKDKYVFSEQDET